MRKFPGRTRGRQRGFTLVEVTIILMVLVILSSILLVQIGDFNRLARFARVKEDVGALCSAISAALGDMGEMAFYHWGGRGDAGGMQSDTPDRAAPVGLLLGDGDVPLLTAGDSNWQQLPGEWFEESKDITGTPVTFRADTFANHLIHNTPADSAGNAYRTPSDMLDGARSAGISGGLRFDPSGGQGFNSRFAWRGPYIADRVEPDPWGNRYMANVFALHVPADMPGDGFGSAVVCYSAGPDEEIDTDFNQPHGWSTGDDDFTALVAAGGGR